MILRSLAKPSLSRGRRGYTLVEMLIVVALLGIAAMLIIPEVSSASALRLQSSVRAIVADINAAQSDALARQEGRAIVFDAATNSYSIFKVVNGAYGPGDELLRVQLQSTGDTGVLGTLGTANFDGDPVLVFDELGGPVISPVNNSPSAGGTLRVSGFGQLYEIAVEAYTGRVTVRRLSE